MRKPVLVIALLAGLVLAEDHKVKILEPKDGTRPTKRKLTVLVESPGKPTVFTIAGKNSTEFAAEPVPDKKGQFRATIEVVSHSDFEIEARHGEETDRVSLKKPPGYKNSSLMATGTPMKDVAFTDASGKPFAFEKKDHVLVHFYSAWDDCELEFAWLASLSKKYGARGLKIVGVASLTLDDLGAWKKYLDAHGATWTHVADLDDSVAKKWKSPEREVIGCAVRGPITYVLHEGKIEAGDYVSWDSVGQLQEGSMTDKTLAEVFK